MFSFDVARWSRVLLLLPPPLLLWPLDDDDEGFLSFLVVAVADAIVGVLSDERQSRSPTPTPTPTLPPRDALEGALDLEVLDTSLARPEDDVERRRPPRVRDDDPTDEPDEALGGVALMGVVVVVAAEPCTISLAMSCACSCCVVRTSSLAFSLSSAIGLLAEQVCAMITTPNATEFKPVLLVLQPTTTTATTTTSYATTHAQASFPTTRPITIPHDQHSSRLPHPHQDYYTQSQAQGLAHTHTGAIDPAEREMQQREEGDTTSRR